MLSNIPGIITAASRAHSPVQQSLLCRFHRPEVKHPRAATQPEHDGTRTDPRLNCHACRAHMEAGSGLNTYLHSVPFFSWVKLRLGRRNILPKVTAAGGRQKHLNPILPGSKAVLLKTTCYPHPAQPPHLCWKPSRVLGTI